MNPFVAKLLIGALTTIGAGAPTIWFAANHLKSRTIFDQLKADNIEAIKDSETDKWNSKINGKNTDEGLRKFVKEHKGTEETTVSTTHLSEACKVAINKKTNETNYSEFKNYCVETKQ